MKTKIQVLLGVLVGILVALVLPVNSNFFIIIEYLRDIVFSMGRYIILPLMFFTMTISVTQLQRKRLLGKETLRLFGLTAIFSLLLVVIGIIASLLFSPGQIPVIIDGISSIEIPKLSQYIEQSIPGNMFEIFLSDFNKDDYQFIPFLLFAVVLGFFMTRTTNEEAEPTFNLIDSLSRIFYTINKYFIKLSFIWTFIFSCLFVRGLQSISDISVFMPLTIMLGSITGFIIFIIYPIICYKLCGKKNIFKFMTNEIPSILTALITGDQFYTLTQLLPSQKTNFKIKREQSGYSLPLLTLFSKSGTALVSVISFMVILKSYSSLEITLTQILWVGTWSFLLSFCLPTKGVGSSIASLFILCSIYGNGGLADSYIILAPAFPIIMAATAVINTATIIIINVILKSYKE